MPFQLDALWVGILGAIGTSTGVWFAGGGQWLRTRYTTWRARRNAETAARRHVYEGFPALESSLAAAVDLLGRISHQVHPNGGGSLADELYRNSAATAGIAQDMSLLRESHSAMLDANPDLGYFECDPDGGNIKVNETYARWMKCGRLDLLGMLFLNFIHPDDVERVRREWALARKERRDYRQRYRMIATDGTVMTFDVRAQPIPPGQDPVQWIGFMRLVRMEPPKT